MDEYTSSHRSVVNSTSFSNTWPPASPGSPISSSSGLPYLSAPTQRSPVAQAPSSSFAPFSAADVSFPGTVAAVHHEPSSHSPPLFQHHDPPFDWGPYTAGDPYLLYLAEKSRPPPPQHEGTVVSLSGHPHLYRPIHFVFRRVPPPPNGAFSTPQPLRSDLPQSSRTTTSPRTLPSLALLLTCSTYTNYVSRSRLLPSMKHLFLGTDSLMRRYLTTQLLSLAPAP